MQVKRREYAVGSVFVLAAYSLRISTREIGRIPAHIPLGLYDYWTIVSEPTFVSPAYGQEACA